MWYYHDEPLDESLADAYVGFIYRITNLTNGKQYIGKKLFKNTRTKKVKGQKRRQRTKTESDWKTYFGSNKNLLEDVTKLGPDAFKREVLMFCTSKGSLNYHEMRYQILEGALESDAYYNEWIMVRVHKSHIKDFSKKL